MINKNVTMEKIVSLCKRRGFVFPGSEIYGGLANTYDYGPLGVELKNNLKKIWWKYFVQDREDMVGLDGGIILSPKVWETSGHVKNFKDPLVECKKCHHRFRPDKLSAQGGSRPKADQPRAGATISGGKDSLLKCPDCGGEFTEIKMFSGMFKTIIGPLEESGLTAYLRPETAQAIFANFKNVLDSGNNKIPFGIGQIGKAFRNEITTGNFIFRTYEFEQMEIEYFIAPDADWNKIFETWLEYIYGYADLIGLPRGQFFNHEIPDAARAFYSKRTIDIEYQFPFGQDELWAIAYRTNYDLSRHQEGSGKSLEYFDEEKKEKFIPHVIEPTFGVDRTILAVLSQAYYEEEIPPVQTSPSPLLRKEGNKKGEGESRKGESRTVLKLKPALAPFKIAIFPLLKNKPELVKKAREIYQMLKQDYNCAWDERGNIGKRYRSQDEIGTPYCLTIDFDSLEKGDVTVRDRDTMKQERIKIEELGEWLEEKLK